ncbi:MAG: acyltransferase [Lachnospiraceae bacterium]|nr:acyltransferase [Lachnospiraceae bacterium]
MIKSEEKREAWIDCLKVICAFLIVLQHSLASAWLQPDMYGPGWTVVNAVMTLAKEGVPLFFMCSGYGMLRRKREPSECVKAAARLLIVYVMWMGVYGTASACEQAFAGAPVKAIAGAFVKKILFGHYHVWFIFVLMGLYLLTPILYPVMQDRKSAVYVMILSFIATIILPVVREAAFFDRFEYTILSFDISSLAGNIFYYLFGYGLGTYFSVDDESKKRKTGAILTVCCMILFICINMATVYYDRIHEEISGRFFDDKGITGCLFVCLIFLTFKMCVNPSDAKGIWKRLSVLGFPIYLLHPLLLNIFPGYPDSDVSDMMAGLVIYLICLIVSILLFRFRYTRILFVTGRKE